MGTPLVIQTAKSINNDIEVQALQDDFLAEKFIQDFIQSINETFPRHSNIQEFTLDTSLEEKSNLKDLYGDISAGFTNSEHTVERLKDFCKQDHFNFTLSIIQCLAHEKYFKVFTDNQTVKYTRIQQMRMLLLYKMFVQKTEGSFTQEGFTEYFDKFMNNESTSTRSNVGLNTGLRFSLSLLQEIHSISAPLLENSLRHLYKALCDAPAGSLYGIDIFAFQQDTTLNEARDFLVSLIEEKSKHSKSLLELCLKTVIRLGIVRSSAEDILVATKLLHGNQDLAKLVDLRDEVRTLTNPNINLKHTEVAHQSVKFKNIVAKNWICDESNYEAKMVQMMDFINKEVLPESYILIDVGNFQYISDESDVQSMLYVLYDDSTRDLTQCKLMKCKHWKRKSQIFTTSDIKPQGNTLFKVASQLYTEFKILFVWYWAEAPINQPNTEDVQLKYFKILENGPDSNEIERWARSEMVGRRAIDISVSVDADVDDDDLSFQVNLLVVHVNDPHCNDVLEIAFEKMPGQGTHLLDKILNQVKLIPADKFIGLSFCQLIPSPDDDITSETSQKMICIAKMIPQQTKTSLENQSTSKSLLSENRGKIKANLKYLSETRSSYEYGGVTNGTTFFLPWKGSIQQVSCPTDPTDSILYSNKNEIYKQEALSRICYLKNKIYIQTPNNPISVLDSDTLKINMDETKAITIAINSQENQTNVKLTGNFDTSCSQRQLLRPMFTDGTNLYCVSAKYNEVTKKPDLYIETYCPTDWRHLKSVQLQYSNWSHTASLDEFLKRSSFCTNGLYLMLCFGKKRHLFSMENGLRIEKQINDSFDASVIHDYLNNRFFTVLSNGKDQLMIDFTIEALNIQKQRNQISSNSIDDMTVMQKFQEQYLYGYTPQAAQNQRERLMNKVKKQAGAASQTQLPTDSGSLVVLILLNFVARNCDDLLKEFTNLDSKTNPSEKYLEFFHWPCATYLTETLFESLKDLLDNFQHLIANPKNKINSAEKYSLLNCIKILNVNIQALNFCGIRLSQIFKAKNDLNSFVDSFNQSIAFIAENEINEIQEAGMDDQVWEKIRQECCKTMTSSVQMMYSDEKDVIQNLIETLTQEKLTERMQDRCSFYFEFLSNKAVIKRLLDDAESIEILGKIVQMIEKFYINYNLEIIQNQLFVQLIKVGEASKFIESCDKFEKALYEQLVIQFENYNVELANKVDKSTEQKNKRIQQEVNLQQLLILISQVFGNLCKRSTEAFSQILEQLTSNKTFPMDQVKTVIRLFRSRIQKQFTSPKKTQLIFLYLSTLSQICIDQSQMFTSVTKSAMDFVESAVKLSNYFKANLEPITDVSDYDISLSSVLNQLIRKACWLVGSLASNLIRIKKRPDNSDPKEKLIRMIVSSKVLSGGIENRFLPSFEKTTKDKLKLTLEMCQDFKSLEIIKNDSILNIEEDEFYNQLLQPSSNKSIEKLIDCLQVCIEHPLANQVHSKLHGTAGMTLQRAAFAVMIKYAQLIDSAQEVIQMVEKEFDKLDTSMSYANRLKEVRIKIMQDETFKKVFQEWIQASQIRKWITEKKKNLSIKIEKIVRDKQNTSQTVKNSEMQIDSSQTSDNLDISEIVESQMSKQLGEIFEKVIAKAQFLLQLEVPVAYQILSDPNFARIRSQREVEETAMKIETESWKDRLIRWKSMQKTEIQVKQEQNLRSQIFERENHSILAILETAVSVEIIKKFVQDDYVQATLRIAGMQILSQLIALPIEDVVVNDLLNWFKASLRAKILSHYVSGIKCRGHQIEKQLRKYFFAIIRSVLEKIKHSNDKNQIVNLLDALKWKFMGKDHTDLVDLKIFKVLREGDGSKNHPLRKTWGKKICDGESLQKEVIEVFEMLLFNIMGRIIDTELGSEIQLKQSGTNLPGLERSKSLLSESVSVSLISQAVMMIFKELSRYPIIFRKFGGSDYQAYFEQQKTLVQPVIQQERQNVFRARILRDSSDSSASDDNSSEQEFQRRQNLRQVAQTVVQPRQVTQTVVQNDDELLFDIDSDLGNSSHDENLENDQFIRSELKRFGQKQVKAINKIYDGTYLRRLLRIVYALISVSQTKKTAQSFVKYVSEPQSLVVLLNLFGYVESRNQLLILKIVSNMISSGISQGKFDATMTLLKATNQSAFNFQSEIQFKSQFINFWFGHLYHIRKSIYDDHTISNHGGYEVSQEIGRLFNTILVQQDSYEAWCKEIKEILTQSLLRIETLSSLDRDLIFALIPGADFSRISVGSCAITQDNQQITVLGFSANFDGQAKLPKIENVCTNINQMVVGLFSNQSHREKQEIIQVSPHCLTQLYSLDFQMLKTLADTSALINTNVLEHLIKLLQLERQSDNTTFQMNLQIMKALSHLSSYATNFIEVLLQKDLLKLLIGLLFKIQQIPQSKDVHVPLNWLEAKVTNMRVSATESLVSLQEQTSVNCRVIKKKSLAFSTLERGFKVTKVILIQSSVNLQNVTDTTNYFINYSEHQASRCGIRLVQFDQMMMLDIDLLTTMKTTGAIVTYDVNLQDFMKNLSIKVRNEKKLRNEEWSQVFQCVVYVIKKDKFQELEKFVQGSSFIQNQSIKLPTVTENDFQDFRQKYESWGGVNFDQLMDKINQLEDKTKDGIRKALSTIIKEVQDQRQVQVQEDVEATMKRLLSEGDERKLNEFIDAQTKKSQDQESRALFRFQSSEFVQSHNEFTDQADIELSIFNILDSNSNFSQLIRDKFVQVIEEEENGNASNNLNQNYFKTINDFSSNQLQKAYKLTLIEMLQQKTSDTLWAIFKTEHFSNIIRDLFQSNDTRNLLQKFLKQRFHQAQQEFIITGANTELKTVKQHISKFFYFCSKQDDSCKDFITTFLSKILKSGNLTLIKLSKSTKQEKISTHFKSEHDFVTGLHPSFLIFMIQTALELRLTQLLESKSCLPALMDLAISMFSYYWQPSETQVPQKLLKQCQNIIFFTQEYLDIFIQSGVAQQITSCPLIIYMINQIDYEKTNLSIVQKLLLDVWLSLVTLKEMVESKTKQKINLNIPSSVLNVKRSLRVMKESLDSQFLRYLIHESTLSETERKSFEKSFETMHPAPDVQIKAKFSFEEMQTISFKATADIDLKQFSCVGVSHRSDGMDMKLYDQGDLLSYQSVSSGECYLFYPVRQSMIIGFGENKRDRMGAQSYAQIRSISEFKQNQIKPIQVKCNRFSTFVLTESRELYAAGGCRSDPCKLTRFTKINLADEIPDKIYEGRRCRFVIAKSGKTFFSGVIKDPSEWPSEVKPTNDLKEFKLSNLPNFDQKIVDIACGSYFNVFLTDKGEIWAVGAILLDKLNIQNRVSPQKLPFPSEDLFALRIWCTSSKRNPVIFAELKSKITHQVAIYSIGKSKYATLGLGTSATQESKVFVKPYVNQVVQFVELSVNESSVLAIDNNGALWSWGQNLNQSIGHDEISSQIINPIKVQEFSKLGLKAIKISMGRKHGLILAQETNGQVSLWSLGKDPSSYFGVNPRDSDSVLRKISAFDGCQILDFTASNLYSMVIVAGSDTRETLYQHQLQGNKKAQGVLHAYQRGSEWQYMPQAEYNHADLPEVSIAFKCPIPNLAAVKNGSNQLELESLKFLLSDEPVNMVSSYSGSKITKVVYSAIAKINGQQVVVNLSENEILNETTQFDMYPLIYFRLKKPLLQGKSLPLLDLSEIYKSSNKYGFKLISIPNLTHDVCSKVIEVKKTEFTNFQDSLKKFPIEADWELYQQMDKQVPVHNSFEFEQYQSYKVQNMNWENFSKIKTVNKQSIENRIKLIWFFNVYFVRLQKYFTPAGLNKGFKGQNIQTQSVTSIINKAKPLILSSIKLTFVRKAIEKLRTGGQTSVTVSRGEARKFVESGQVDHTGEFTIFGQIFKQLNGKYDCWKHNKVDAQALCVKFLNERSIDVGGPFREVLTNIVQEMESGALPLIIKTANNKINYGENRDCFILNAESTMPTHRAMFKFLGVLIGFAFRSGSCIPFNFAPIVWKQIINEIPKEIDITTQDTFIWQNFRDLRKNALQITNKEEFEQVVDQNFTYTQNGVEIELCIDGASKKVDQTNLEEFIQLTCNKIFEQGKQQANWIQEGMQIIIQTEIVSILDWRDVEERVCGAKTIDIEKLRRMTIYKNCSEDQPVIKNFWAVMLRMSEENKSKYLGFVWGRRRLPTDVSNLKNQHMISVINSWPTTKLPEAHTCFFALDIPRYQSEEELEKKLMISIRFCGEIDNDEVDSDD